VLALGALLIAGAVLVAFETRGTTFADDEWLWIEHRLGGGLHTYLDPHNSHLSLVPIAIYKLLFATVGLHHYWPYRAVVIAAHLTCVTLLFVYARRRVGTYAALLAAALIVFFGPGWQDFLWPFQMAWLIALGAGLGALLMLDRGDRFGDRAACLLLCVSLASAGPGLAIAAGVTLELLLRRRWRDLWIVAIPIGLYLVWWALYQQTSVTRDVVFHVTRFVFNAAAGALSSLLGVSGENVASGAGDFTSWGAPLLVLAVACLAWRLRRMHQMRGIPPRVVTLLAIPLAFWLIAAIGRAYVQQGPFVYAGTGYESRYLYIGAVLILLVAVEAARGASMPLSARLIGGVVVLAAVLSNIGTLRDGSLLLRGEAAAARTELGTLDITRGIVPSNYVSAGFIFGIVNAGDYFAAERQLGTPADTPAQIAAEPDANRQAADAQLVSIHRVALVLAPPVLTAPASGTRPYVEGWQAGTPALAAGCVRFRAAAYVPASAAAAIELRLPAAGIALTSQGGPATVGVRRFGSEFQQIGAIAPGGQTVLRISPDLAPQPWYVQVAPTAVVLACALG
jgi:hypothetical protein